MCNKSIKYTNKKLVYLKIGAQKRMVGVHSVSFYEGTRLIPFLTWPLSGSWKINFVGPGPRQAQRGFGRAPTPKPATPGPAGFDRSIARLPSKAGGQGCTRHCHGSRRLSRFGRRMSRRGEKNRIWRVKLRSKSKLGWCGCVFAF